MSTTTVYGFSDGDVTCRGCGRTIHLWFNGGELDRRECCGYTYETYATGYALQIVSLSVAGASTGATSATTQGGPDRCP